VGIDFSRNIRVEGVQGNGNAAEIQGFKAYDLFRQEKPVGAHALDKLGEFSVDEFKGPEGFLVCQRISGSCYADNFDNRPENLACHHFPYFDNCFLRGQNPAGNAGARFVGAVVLPRAVATLDIAAGRYRQMHSSVVFVIAAKTGMALYVFLLIAARCH
jgi:hypothetical protein